MEIKEVQVSWDVVIMKYKAIAEQIVFDIQSRKLAPGQKLPSLRQLSKQLDVSMTTATNSYRSLEESGWVVTQPKSGFFVSNPLSYGDTPSQPQFRSSSRSLPKSLAFKNQLDHQVTVGPLGESQLNPKLMPTIELQRSIKRTLRKNTALLHSYSDPQGDQALRRALSKHFSANGFTLSADELLISNGCMDAIRMALLATTKPGDAVAISSPCFNGLLKLLASLSRKAIEIPCNADGVDLPQLERLINGGEVKAALLSSSHMNPHGLSLSIAQKQTLAALANKHRVPIIEDDVYGELGYENTFPLPIKHWDTNGYVLWCSSVSKTLASGLRVGWCSAGRYLESCIDRCDTEQLGHNALLPASLASFIEGGHYRKHLQSIRKSLVFNVNAYRTLLLDHLPKGSAISAPKGGLVLWVQVPGLDNAALSKVARESDIDLRFGAQFTTRKLYRECFRLNIGWRITENYDEKRTIESVLLQLIDGINAAIAK